ncbi:hypothetical protein HJC23_005228 [Cyclotella cryptica]|uniref:Hexosyltransferase n=1 Tax=Cyclotella cryptica TaxID=29204 RepID=A0ABD3NUH7_9STRA|eukprot:CCRYP_019684-RA/>CCRYP_019684-RA protein AED:0.23 eAED:0.23 QI:124/-1/1/1/-1/1/1/26/417
MAPPFTNTTLFDRRGKKQRFSIVNVVGILVVILIIVLAVETKIFIFNPQKHPPPQTKSPGSPKAFLNDGGGSKNVRDSWCDRVKQARSTLDEKLHVRVPCETMKQAKSAVVVYITAGVSEDKATKTVFSGKDYIDGVMALGASLNDHLLTKETHRLLLLRDDFMSSLPDSILAKLKKIGWTIGIAPVVDIDEKYVPRFARYKTVYTKISVLGLSEYDCVLLLDADTLVVGNIDDLMTCNILKPNFRAAGGLDLYHGQWRHFNTGSVLWRPGSDEMNRVYNLTSDPTFMKRFESDQIFTNTVYPHRNNVSINNELMAGRQVNPEQLGSIAHLPWEYNAQTHLEYQRPQFWDEHVSDLKIIHFTQKKGWQCQKRLDRPPPLSSNRPATKDCTLETDCACQEGYKWYQYLKKAEDFAVAK